MTEQYKIGIDIGGSNTDAVLIDASNSIIATAKTVTTDDISCGVENVLKKLLFAANSTSTQIAKICFGTTQATNALLQKTHLFRVGVLRIAGQYPSLLPPGFNWPQDLANKVIAHTETVSGGFECNGSEITPFSSSETIKAVHQILQHKVDAIAVVGTFSPLSNVHETNAQTIIKDLLGEDFPVSLSSKIGGIGFIERENSTILNSALKLVMKRGFDKIKSIIKHLDLTCEIMIVQNDGTVIDIETAIDYPITTISAGPNNSFIGGARLGNFDRGIIIDIGGTSTDVGLVCNQFPVRNLNPINIGGVTLDFPVPNVLSIALGGGSQVFRQNDQWHIGPVSVGNRLKNQAFSFGGSILTLTDVALKLGYLSIPEADPAKVPISFNEAKAIIQLAYTSITDLIQKIIDHSEDYPIVFVGGGARLFTPMLSREQIPPYFDVANAYGAAMAEIGGTVDIVTSLQDRDFVLSQIRNNAKARAIENGACPSSIRLIDQQIIPYPYIPNQLSRVIVRFAGQQLHQDEMC